MSTYISYAVLGLNFEISFSFSYNFFSSLVSSFGTTILTIAVKSPLSPLPSLYPFCGIFSFSPLAIPAGTNIDIVSSIPSKFTLVPSAASDGVKYNDVYKSYPINSNFLLASLCIHHYILFFLVL